MMGLRQKDGVSGFTKGVKANMILLEPHIVQPLFQLRWALQWAESLARQSVTA